MEIIKLNLIPSGVNPVCHCSQYDNGRVIRCELFNGLTPYTLASGDTVTLNARKPDNTIITASVTATQGNNYVDITTTEQLCAVVGETLCKLKITNGSTEIGTLIFYMQVERDVLADGDPSQSVIEDLDELVQEAVGDNYYTKSTIINLLRDSEKDITLNGILNVNFFPTTNYTDGKYLNYNTGNESTNANYFYTDYIFVSPMFSYYFANVQSANTHVCFYDENKTYISGVILQTGSALTIPSGAFYMRVSFLIAGRANLGLYIISNYKNTAQGTSYYIELFKNAPLLNVTAVLPANYNNILPNLNNAQDNMIYLILGSAFAVSGMPANMPYNIYIEPAILYTAVASGYKKQFLYTNTGIFTRVYASGSWGDWFVVKKPVLSIPNGTALVRVMESGMPCDINLTADVELYAAYKSAKGADYWDNYQGYSTTGDRNDSGLYMHPHVNFNGNGHTVSFTPTTVTTPIQRDFSPFNLGGDNILENVIIDIGFRNCRYAIHDDFAVTTEGEIIRNVTMKGTGVSPALIGAGVKPYCSYIVENCICLDNQGDCDILYHSSTQNVQAASYLVIKNCYCEKSINIKYVGTNQVITPCIVTGNKAYSITLSAGSGSTPYENMNLIAWNNVTEV